MTFFELQPLSIKNKQTNFYDAIKSFLKPRNIAFYSIVETSLPKHH